MLEGKELRKLNDHEKAFVGIYALAEVLGVDRKFAKKLFEMDEKGQLGEDGADVIRALIAPPETILRDLGEQQ